MQNEALRAITGLSKTCPVDFLRLEANIEPLRDRLEKNDEITWDKFERLPENDSRKNLLTTIVPSRLKTRIGWRNATLNRMRDFELKRETTTTMIAPWKELECLTVEEVTLEKKKGEYSTEELRTKTMEKLNSIETTYRIFTDGSTDENQENGGAGIYIEDRNGLVISEESVPAGKLCSSYAGEAVAFLHALDWIRQLEVGTAHSENTTTTILVAVDSKSLTEALQMNNWKDPDPWLKRIKESLFDIKSTITLLWIPSHCGIDGNDKADELARKGSSENQDDVPVTHAIVKAKIKGRKWNLTHDRAKEMYRDRRHPKMDVEKMWPRKARRLYAKLRSGHTMELKHYRHKVDAEEDGLCDECEVEETLQHVLCECRSLDEARARNWEGIMDISMMVSEPEICRKILAHRFGALVVKKKKNEQEHPSQG